MTNSSTKPPVWFWIVSVIAFLWNAMGVNAYLQQAYNTDGFRATYNDAQLALIDSTPAWATAAFALAVFGGVLGCLALLLRKKWAKPLLQISLIGVVVQFAHGLFFAKSYEVFGTFETVMSFLVPVVSVLLVYLASKAIARGWIS